MIKPILTCSITDCDSTFRLRKGMCNKHALRLKRYGDPFFTKHLRGIGNTEEERFWNRVDKSSHPQGCWLWKGYTNPNGYGETGHFGKTERCHRVAYKYARGKWPVEMALHSCDNRSCCNPDHLRDGTHQDNMDDKAMRNRIANGTDLPQAKLTEADILLIRQLIAEGYTQQSIANRFGVGQDNISRIHTGKYWAHVK